MWSYVTVYVLIPTYLLKCGVFVKRRRGPVYYRKVSAADVRCSELCVVRGAVCGVVSRKRSLSDSAPSGRKNLEFGGDFGSELCVLNCIYVK